MNAPTIYHLAVDRFRSLRSFSWQPASGVNVILGGGDVGKTTILDAIGLLFSPSNPFTLSDTDYFERRTEDEFVIRAVVSLPSSVGMNHQVKPSWPWHWDGKQAVVPDLNTEGTPGEPVYCFRVRGTEDLELIHEIVQPNDEAEYFSPTLRRAIGLVRLVGEDRNDRDLRLVQGSALDRLLSDKALRSRLTVELAKSEVSTRLLDDARETLKALDAEFAKRNLPSTLDLAITGSHGQSVAALIGLTAKRGTVQLPLASWGAGTRRFATLAIAEQNQGEAPFTLVDEAERGLEPYRQRLLMDNLETGSSQAFLTTHSPSMISAASEATLWYVDHVGTIGEIGAKETKQFRQSDPEMFLSRLSVVAEGSTEVGFVEALLQRALGPNLHSYGIHITDGGGHETTLSLLEALSKSGLSFAGFADNEGNHPKRWQALQAKLAALLFRWETGCVESNVINLIPIDRLEDFIADPEGVKTGRRLRTLAQRLEIEGPGKEFSTIQDKAGPNLKAIITGAATGDASDIDQARKKEFKTHGRDWFKSRNGGAELFAKVMDFGIWPELKPPLIRFCNGVRTALGLAEISDITQ